MRTLALLGMAAILMGFFFQCCPSTAPEAEPIPGPKEEPTAPPPTGSIIPNLNAEVQCRHRLSRLQSS